jgi:hypothetical protein
MKNKQGHCPVISLLEAIFDIKELLSHHGVYNSATSLGKISKEGPNLIHHSKNQLGMGLSTISGFTEKNQECLFFGF